MDIKQLQEKIRQETQKNQEEYKISSPQERRILTMTVKLNEEVGELCNDILAVLKLQRKSKLEKFEKKNFYEEFADVIITTLQLASVAGVDVERAINDKLKKINEKYNKDH